MLKSSERVREVLEVWKTLSNHELVLQFQLGGYGELDYNDEFVVLDGIKYKPGKLINKFLAPHFNQHEIYKAVVAFKAAIKINNYTFKVVEGEAIKDFYDERNYAEGNYTLNNSCMRNASQRDYLQVYAEHCKLYSLSKGGKVYARCLSWTIEGKEYIDNIYAVSDVEEKILSYKLKDKQLVKDYELSIDVGYYDKMPSLDNFKHYSGTYLYNTKPSKYLCTNSNGTFLKNKRHSITGQYITKSITTADGKIVKPSEVISTTDGRLILKQDAIISQVIKYKHDL